MQPTTRMTLRAFLPAPCAVAPLAAALVLMALGGCNGPDGRTPRLAEGRAFDVALRQDGRTVPIRDHQAHLARRPFALVLAFGKLERVLVHASFQPDMVRAVAAGRPMASVLPLPRRTPPAPLFNPQRALVVSDEAYQLWYYLGPAIHRFDKDGIREVDGAYLCRQTVAAYATPDGPTRPLSRLRPHTLYLVLTATDMDPTTKHRTQGQTEYLALVVE